MACPNLRNAGGGFFQPNLYYCSCNGGKIDIEYKISVCEDRGNTKSQCRNYQIYGVCNSNGKNPYQ